MDSEDSWGQKSLDLSKAGSSRLHALSPGSPLSG